MKRIILATIVATFSMNIVEVSAAAKRGREDTELSSAAKREKVDPAAAIATIPVAQLHVMLAQFSKLPGTRNIKAMLAAIEARIAAEPAAEPAVIVSDEQEPVVLNRAQLNAMGKIADASPEKAVQVFLQIEASNAPVAGKRLQLMAPPVVVDEIIAEAERDLAKELEEANAKIADMEDLLGDQLKKAREARAEAARKLQAEQELAAAKQAAEDVLSRAVEDNAFKSGELVVAREDVSVKAALAAQATEFANSTKQLLARAQKMKSQQECVSLNQAFEVANADAIKASKEVARAEEVLAEKSAAASEAKAALEKAQAALKEFLPKSDAKPKSSWFGFGSFFKRS